MYKTLKALLLLFAIVCSRPASAQTISVNTGSISTTYAASTDEMPFVNGNSISIGGNTYPTASIDSICITPTQATNSAVVVDYSGNTAHVTVSGNIAPYITTTVNGAHVSILQSESLGTEVTYTLQGASSNGSFWMDGSLKASIVLNGVQLTCADSAAFNVRDGKRISIALADGTANTFCDGTNGQQKGCFMVKGHTEFKGGGSLTLTGKTGHAFWGGEYVELKKTTGTITVSSAVKDAFNVNQYFQMKGGTVSIISCGDDGLQVSKTDDTTDEWNGQVRIAGGKLSINCSATAAKGITCEDSLFVSGGEISITTTGGGTYDSSTADASASAAIKSDAAITIDGGTLTLKSTGAGGKGIKGNADVIINGGDITITTTGKQYSYNRDSCSPKGIRATGNLIITGGTVNVTCSGGEGSEGLESKKEIRISGGDVIANTYDDALNAASKIDISGGRIYAYASNNDGIDSNGTLYISGGLVISSGTTEPEEGFDCDQNTFSITGGTLIGMGGSTSTPTSSVTTQPVFIVSRTSLTQGKYLTLNDASGNCIWSFAVPRTYNSCTLLISSPSLSTGNSYTLASGATVSGGSTWQGYSADATVSGGSTLSTVTLSSIVTNNGSSSQGGWGGGGGPGGGGGGGNRPGGR